MSIAGLKCSRVQPAPSGAVPRCRRSYALLAWRLAIQQVTAWSAVEFIIASLPEQDVAARAAQQQIATTPAEQAVSTIATLDDIVVGGAEQHLGRTRPAQVEMRRVFPGEADTAVYAHIVKGNL